MSPLRRIFRGVRRNRGLALIIVLSMLALSTIVMLAFLTVAETEFKSTTSYSNTQSARRLADTALNLVIGQIRAGTDQDLAVPGTEFMPRSLVRCASTPRTEPFWRATNCSPMSQ